jgi:RecA-family ATPase
MEIKALTATEYLSLPQPPQRWVVDQLIPAQSLVVLWGPAKEGKTTLALQAGCSVTQGLPFLGYDTQRGPVLLLQVDTPRPELTQILIRLSSQGLSMNGLFLPDPAQLEAHKPMNLLDKDTLFYLQTLVKMVQPSLVIVDCFRELGNFKENVSEEQRPIVNTLKAVTTNHPTYPCACLLIHHTTKLTSREVVPDAKDAGRGSGYLAGAVDSIWFLYQNKLQMDPRFAKKQTLYLTHSPEGLWSLAGS